MSSLATGIVAAGLIALVVAFAIFLRVASKRYKDDPNTVDDDPWPS